MLSGFELYPPWVPLRSGVKIFVVAVGKNVRSIDEMVRVASYPPINFLFRVKKLDGFLQIIKLMVRRYSP